MAEKQLRLTGRIGGTPNTSNASCRCGKCGGILPKTAPTAPAPPQTSWTLDQARVARQKLVTQSSDAARRAVELIDLAFPTLAAEAAELLTRTAAPAMPSMVDRLQNASGRPHPHPQTAIAYPNPTPTVAAGPVGDANKPAPKMPSMVDAIRKRK